MILTLRFSGIFLHKCDILRNEDLLGTIKQSGILSKRALVDCPDFKWEIAENKEEKISVQIHDLDGYKLIGEAEGVEGTAISNINIEGNLYILSEKEKAPNEYVWIDKSKEELIHYDITNLEDFVASPFKKGRYAMASIPDDPSVTQMMLFFLGLFILRLRVMRIGAHHLQGRV